MKILLDINHPKDVNVFRNVIRRLERNGHEIKIIAGNKENTLEVLSAYGFDYIPKKHYRSLVNKAIGMLKSDYTIYKVSKEFKPDIFVSFGSPFAAQVSKLFRKPHISFSDTDTEVVSINLFAILTLPFSEVDYVPACLRINRGPKQKRFNGYYELAYLHPRYFNPDPTVLEKLGLSRNERYIILRFSALTSHHDIGVHGFDFKSNEELSEFIRELKDYGHVFITSEIKLSRELEKYKVKISPNDLHSFISFATLYLGEGATMAAEAAVLGVPSIYVSTTTRGYLDELEEKYGLAFTISSKDKALKKALELLEDKDIKTKWQRKREIMLNEKIDVTKFMEDVIEKWGNG